MKFAHLGIVALALAWFPMAARAGAPAVDAATKASCGISSSGALKCPRFGFAYKIPFGWVDRTADLGEPSQPESGQDAASPPGQAKVPGGRASSAAAETLLAVFERPPGAPGDTINSAVVIAAEPAANYPQVKTAADYFGAINEVAEHDGFTAVEGPYAFPVGEKQLVRGDFSKQRGKLTMWQSTLVAIEKGYIVSFTFIGGSQDENDELISNLSFRSTAPSSHGVKK